MGNYYFFGALSSLFMLLTVAAVIALVVFVSKEFERIAVMKGHPGRRYFWWTFFTGFIGMLMVAALPDRAAPQPADKDGFVPDRLPPV